MASISRWLVPVIAGREAGAEGREAAGLADSLAAPFAPRLPARQPLRLARQIVERVPQRQKAAADGVRGDEVVIGCNGPWGGEDRIEEAGNRDARQDLSASVLPHSNPSGAKRFSGINQAEGGDALRVPLQDAAPPEKRAMRRRTQLHDNPARGDYDEPPPHGGFGRGAAG